MCVWQFYQNAKQNYSDTYHTNTARFVGIRFLTVFLTNIINQPEDSSQPNSQFKTLLVQRLWRHWIKNSNTFHINIIRYVKMKKQHVHVHLTLNLMLYEQLIQIQGKKIQVLYHCSLYARKVMYICVFFESNSVQ